jgi:hypothetical protein
MTRCAQSKIGNAHGDWRRMRGCHALRLRCAHFRARCVAATAPRATGGGSRCGNNGGGIAAALSIRSRNGSVNK